MSLAKEFRVAIARRPVTFNQDLKALIANECISPEFLYYALVAMRDGIKDRAGEASHGTKKLETDVLRRLLIPVPDRAVQDRMVDVLSAYDDLIENNRRRIALLEQAGRLLYREWFVHFRFPRREHVKTTDGLPEGWREKHLSEVVTTQYGFTETATDEAVGPKFLRGTDINKTSYIDWDSVPYCPEQNLDFAQYALKPGDILVIRMADPGKVAIVERDIRAVFASYLVRLQVRPEADVLPLYLFYVMSGPAYQGFIRGASEKSTRKSASAPLLTNFMLLVPPRTLQAEFVEIVDGWRRQMSLLLQQNVALGRARGLLMPKLMSGELEV